MNKKDLRIRLKALCRKVSHEERQVAAMQAAKLLTASTLFQNSQQIAGYFAHQDEFDCSPILKSVQQAGKQCYLPILTSENTLEFGLFEEGGALQANRFGILEPTSQTKISPAGLDLVILPLIGFDTSFKRLGTGGGYYDRTFAFLINSINKKPFLMGLAYDFQAVDELPNDPWDVPLAGVLTEKYLKF